MISNSKELLKALQTDATIELSADIYFNDTLDWNSWSLENKPKNIWPDIVRDAHVVIHGNGHTIYGLYTDSIQAGLLANVTSCEITDLTIKQSYIHGYDFAGGFVGVIKGTEKSSFENCKVEECKVVSDTAISGGLVGCAANSEISFVKCYNMSESVSGRIAGGILGSSQFNEGTKSNTQFTECYNNSEIHGLEIAGGIAGEVYTTNDQTYLKNNGNVSEGTCGGIFGKINVGSPSIKVRNINNNGVINNNADSTTAFIGEKSENGSFIANKLVTNIGSDENFKTNIATIDEDWNETEAPLYFDADSTITKDSLVALNSNLSDTDNVNYTWEPSYQSSDRITPELFYREQVENQGVVYNPMKIYTFNLETSNTTKNAEYFKGKLKISAIEGCQAIINSDLAFLKIPKTDVDESFVKLTLEYTGESAQDHFFEIETGSDIRYEILSTEVEGNVSKTTYSFQINDQGSSIGLTIHAIENVYTIEALEAPATFAMTRARGVEGDIASETAVVSQIPAYAITGFKESSSAVESAETIYIPSLYGSGESSVPVISSISLENIQDKFPNAKKIVIGENISDIKENTFAGFDKSVDLQIARHKHPTGLGMTYEVKPKTYGKNAFGNSIKAVYVDDLADWFASDFNDVKRLSEVSGEIVSESSVGYANPVIGGAVLYNGTEEISSVDFSQFKFDNQEILVDYIGSSACATGDKFSYSNMENITSIGDGAFYGFKGTLSLGSLTSVGEYAFAGFGDDADLNLTVESLNEISAGLFANRNFENISLTNIPVLENEFSIGDFAFYKTNLSNEIISRFLTEKTESVGAYAFSTTNLIGDVVLNSVKRLSKNCFENCSELTSFSVGTSVESVGTSIFKDCNALTSLNVPLVHDCFGKYFADEVVKGDKTSEEICSYRNILPVSLKTISIVNSLLDETKIPIGYFSYTSDLETVDLSALSGNIDIKEYAFYKSGIKTLNNAFENGLFKAIGNYSFDGCSKFTDKLSNLGNGNDIGICAFRNCSALTEAVFSTGDVNIGNSAFADCSSLVFDTENATIINVGDYAFKNTKITSIEITGSVGFYALDKCYGLESYTGPIRIEDGAGVPLNFILGVITPESHPNLAKIEINHFGVSYIPESFMLGLSQVTDFSITTDEVIEEIRHGAFAGCSGLASFTIPTTVKDIGVAAFSSCSGISSFNFNELTELDIVRGRAFADCTNLEEVVFYKETGVHAGDDFLQGCPNIKKLVNVKWNVASLADFGLSDKSKLEEVALRAGSQTDIGADAFKNAISLVSVIIPNNIENIGANAFDGCSSLNKLTTYTTDESIFDISELEGINSIGAYAFRDCNTSAIFQVIKLPGLISGTVGKGILKNVRGREIYGNFTKSGEKLSSVLNINTVNKVELYGNIDSIASQFFGSNNMTLKEASIYCRENTSDYVTNIGSRIFGECEALESIYLPFIGATLEDAEANSKLHGKNKGLFGYLFDNIIEYSSYIKNDKFYNAFQTPDQTFEDLDIDAVEDYVPIIERYSNYSTIYHIPKTLKTVRVSSAQTTIPNGAFMNCKFIENTIFEGNISRIGYNAFLNNTENESLNDLIGDNTANQSLEVVGNAAFANCPKLTGKIEISYPFFFGSYAFAGTGIEEAVINSRGKNLYHDQDTTGLFANCKNLKRIGLSLYNSAFAPNGVDGFIIGDNFASECSNLFEVRLQSTGSETYSIGKNAFSGCHSLEAINDSVDDISAFQIEYDEELSDFIEFRGTGYKAWKLYDNLLSNALFIDDAAFKDCTSLRTLKFTNNTVMKRIGEEAFYNCAQLNLNDSPLPGSLTEIDRYAFSYCARIGTVGLSNTSVNLALYNPFENCTGLQEITIPATVNKIWRDMYSKYSYNSYVKSTILNFKNCFNLEKIVVRSTGLLEGNDSTFYSTADIRCDNSKKIIQIECDSSKMRFTYIPNETEIKTAYSGQSGNGTVVSAFSGSFGSWRAALDTSNPTATTGIARTYELGGTTYITGIDFRYSTNMNYPDNKFNIGSSNKNTVIYQYAFYGVNFLDQLIAPSMEVKEYAFKNCCVPYVSGNFKTLHDYAFADSRISSLANIQSSATFGGNHVFENANKLIFILNLSSADLSAYGLPANLGQTISSSSVSKPSEDYGLIKLSSYIIGSSCRIREALSTYYGGGIIYPYAFDNNASLKKIGFASTRSAMGAGRPSLQIFHHAFSGALNLSTIDLGSVNVTSNSTDIPTIGESAFENLSFIEKVYLPQKIVTSSASPDLMSASNHIVGKNAFRNCSRLREIDGFYSIKTINDNAFEGTDIRRLSRKETDEVCCLENVGKNVFLNSSIYRFDLPTTVTRFESFGSMKSLQYVDQDESILDYSLEVIDRIPNTPVFKIPASLTTITDNLASLHTLESNCYEILTYNSNFTEENLAYEFEINGGTYKKPCVLSSNQYGRPIYPNSVVITGIHTTPDGSIYGQFAGEKVFAFSEDSIAVIHAYNATVRNMQNSKHTRLIYQPTYGSKSLYLKDSCFANSTSLVGIIGIDVNLIEPNAFISNSNLRFVHFYKCESNDTKNIIGSRSFKSCHKLKYVTLPYTSSVTNESAMYSGRYGIGDAAFYDCISLEKIIIPAGVRSIGKAAFRGMQPDIHEYLSWKSEYGNLEKEFYDNNVSISNMPRHTSKLKVYFEEQSYLEYIAPSAFMNTSLLKKSGSFYNATDIFSFVNNSSSLVTKFEIAEFAFAYCGIKTIDLANSKATSLSGNAFYSTTPIVEVLKVPSTMTKCELGSGLNNITAIYAPSASAWANMASGYYGYGDSTKQFNPTKYWELYDLSGNRISAINIENVERIGDGAFFKIASLASFTMDNNVRYIGQNAISPQYLSTKVKISDNIEYFLHDMAYGSDVYQTGTKNSYEYVMSNSGNYVVWYSYTNNKTPSTFTPDATCRVFGMKSDMSYSSTTTMNIPPYLQSIGGDFYSQNAPCPFYSSNLRTLQHLNSSTDEGAYSKLRVKNKVLINMEKNSIVKMTNQSAIDDGIEGIESFAFSGLDAYGGYLNLTIPKSVKYIKDFAFANGTLESITIEGDIENIEEDAFTFGTVDGDIVIDSPEAISKITSSYSFGGLFYRVPYYETSISISAKGLEEYNKLYGPHPYFDSLSSSSYKRINSGNYVVFLPKLNVTPGLYIDGYEYPNLQLSLSWDEIINSGYLTLTNGVLKKGTTSYSFSGRLFLPDTVTEIYGTSSSDGCFYNSKLTAVYIPESVKKIGAYAFGASSTTNGNIRNLRIYGDLEEIGDYAFFYNGPTQNRVILPDSLKILGASAFRNSSSMPSVSLSKNLSSIGDYAFSNCQYLSDAALSEGTTNIGSYAFQYCYRLRSINIPSTVTTIGASAFDSCGSELYYTTSSISGYFNPLHSIDITVNSNNISSVGSNAFKGVGNYYAPAILRFGDNVTTLPGLNIAAGEIIMTDNVVSIADKAIDATRLKNVVFSKNLKTIGANNFCNGTALESIYIPDTVESIGSGSFKSLKGLKEIHLPNNSKFTTIPSNMLTSSGAPIEKLEIPENVTTLNSNFSSCNVKEFTLPENITTLSSFGSGFGANLERFNYNCKRVADSTYAQIFNNCEIGSNGNGIDLVFGPSVQHIPAYLFASSYADRCSHIKTITMTDSVSSIGKYAFSRCADLESVQLSAGITTIETYTFYLCTSLKEINIPNGVTVIGPQAFYQSGLKRIVIPNGVLTIDKSAFAGCSSLEYISLPESLTTLGQYAFNQTSVLNTIEYNCANLTNLTSGSSGPFLEAGLNGDGITVTFTDSVISIPNYLFYPDSSTNSTTTHPKIKNVTIGSNVNRIGNSAFRDCSELESATFIGSNNWSYQGDVVIPVSNDPAINASNLRNYNSVWTKID